jgi:phosphoribulokinase
MIIFKDLTFGDIVYKVIEKNHVMKQKRLTMTDANGDEWHRYDRDRFEYSIEEIEYVGKVRHHEEGEVRFNEEYLTEFHFKYPNGQIYFEHEHYLKDWFTTREVAEENIELLKAYRAI